jgi:dTDP-4-amino-4,6-dideoxygalactose transaminase
MHIIGEKEIEAVAKVIRSGKLFRYGVGHECDRFERRYEKYLGVKHARMTTSGTEAIRAALIGLKVGPGDEVLVPACTYMASALGVLAAGAIPVIVDIDESLTLDPKAVEKAIGPRTRAILPVHMWGLPCNMRALMGIARKHKLLVIEDACQAVGGGYRGKKLGSIGHAGCFSFNYFKNLSCGEGGAYVTNNETVARRGQCVNESCEIYWSDEASDEDHFASSGSRASEIGGAIMNVQLGRLDPLIRSLRRQKKRILEETKDTGLKPIKANSIDDECGTHLAFMLQDTKSATAFSKQLKGDIAGQTGRHVFTEWLPVLNHRGGPCPALNPYLMKENRPCRKKYSKGMCAQSLDILNRTVLLTLKHDAKRADVTKFIKRIGQAAKSVLD